MKINELAKKAGLTASAIRYYEKRGLIDARHVRRGENQYRDYDEQAVEQLQMIREAQLAGFTLAEIRELDKACSAGQMTARRASAYLEQKIASINEKIEGLRHMRSFLKSKKAEML